jgi:REP element-mobilizing transposase RayT
MVWQIWTELPKRFAVSHIDTFVVMPNHLHGIVVVEEGRAGMKPAPTLGTIIGAFKSITTHEYIDSVRKSAWKAFDRRLWQRNYYEHIIRDDDELRRARQYIENNPLQWALDKEDPGR